MEDYVPTCAARHAPEKQAERMIQQFKNHFRLILAGVNATFPPYLWDLLLPQAKKLLIYYDRPQFTQSYPAGNTSMVYLTSIRLL
jgi:hypothetical protein